MTNQTFSGLGVAEPLCRALQAENYTNPTPIQLRAIPLLLEGRDLLGIAQTGTGKTAAFALPILQKLSKPQHAIVPRAAHALILAPTRELAVQIGESFATYGRHLGLRHTVILGGVGQPAQVKAMARGVDILIATPGRLLDLVQQRHVRLDQVKHFVLDEADRMLDMGFIRDVRRIVALLPKERQSLLFSATMPNDVAKLAAEMLRSPVRVEVTPEAVTVDKVRQRDDLFHVMDEAHVEHAVGFVQDHGLDAVELDVALSDEVEEAPRRRHQDVDAAGHRGDLGMLADPAEDDGGTHAEMASIGPEALADLEGELAGRGQHQNPRFLAPGGGASRCEKLQDRQRKGGSLAGAGLGDAEEVLALEELRDGLRLDRRRLGVSLLFERAPNRLDKSQVFK